MSKKKKQKMYSAKEIMTIGMLFVFCLTIILGVFGVNPNPTPSGLEIENLIGG